MAAILEGKIAKNVFFIAEVAAILKKNEGSQVVQVAG